MAPALHLRCACPQSTSIWLKPGERKVCPSCGASFYCTHADSDIGWIVEYDRAAPRFTGSHEGIACP